MDDKREKLISPPQDGQVSQGTLNQASHLMGEEIGGAAEWVEIHRSRDDWEVKLIQTALGAQQIRCRPVQIKSERQTALLVEGPHQVAALELVSRVGVAMTDNEMTTPQMEALKQRDIAAVAMPEQQVEQTNSDEIVFAKRDSIGSIVYRRGRGYELRVGSEPYIIVPEEEWEEFTDFSAQRQEFFILLRHEYPTLFEWLQQEKLLAEFIRLIEMTYQEGAPSIIRTETADYPSSVSSEIESTYNSLAFLSLSIGVMSLFTLLFQAPWFATLIFSLISIATAIIAKSQIDASESKNRGGPMAFGAVVLACLAIVLAWWFSQQPPPAVPENPSSREVIEDR